MHDDGDALGRSMDSVGQNSRTKTGPQHVHSLICWLEASLLPSIKIRTKYDLRSWTGSRWRWGSKELVVEELGVVVTLLEEVLLPPVFEIMLPWLSTTATLVKSCQRDSILAERWLPIRKENYRSDSENFIECVNLSATRCCRCCCSAHNRAQVSCSC